MSRTRIVLHDSEQEGVDKLGPLLADDTGPIALDTETVGWAPGDSLTGPTRPEVICVTLAGKEWSAYLSGPHIIPLLGRFLMGRRLLMHNAPFDLSALVGSGLVSCGWARSVEITDTAVLDWYLDTSREHGLKACARDHLKRSPASYESVVGTPALRKDGKPYASGKLLIPDTRGMVKDERFIDYALADAENTYDLYVHLAAKMTPKQKQVWISEVKPITRIVWEMGHRGMAVNVAALKASAEAAEADRDRIESGLREREPGVKNWGSTKEIRELLYTKYAMRAPRVTPGGAEATGVAVLQELLDDAPDGSPAKALLPDLLSLRLVSKQVEAFFRPLPDRVIKGRVHCSFRQNGTVSGRLSCNSPNLQQVSNRRDVYGLRNALCASERKLFIIADYAALEWVLATHWSQDAALMRIQTEDLDAHAYTASGTFAGPAKLLAKLIQQGVGLREGLLAIKSEYHEDRDNAKTLNYALLYGAGAKTLARTMKCSVEEADRRRTAWCATYPGYVAWTKDVVNGARRQMRNDGEGWVETLAGRRRHINAADWGDDRFRGKEERSLVNAIIQGTAADLMNRALISISRDETLRALGYRLLLQVHDEAVGEAPEATAEECARRVQAHMQAAHRDKLRVNIKATVAIGPTWAAKK